MSGSELVELSTWQTFSKMGLVEHQIVHLGKVEDADMQPVSLAAFYVVSTVLRGVVEANVEDEADVGANTASQQAQQLQQSQQGQQRDWHSVLKL